MTTVAEALQTAVGYHRADRFDEARALYLRILEVDPRNAHAMHLLGLAERRLGRPAATTLAPATRPGSARRPGA